MKAAKALTDRARSLGWRVKIMQPPEQGDWNDAAMATEVAA